MKCLIQNAAVFLAFLTVGACSTLKDSSVATYDNTSFMQATVVLRAEVLSPGEGSKYLWPAIRVLKVLKRPNGVEIPQEMEVAHYSFGAGLPLGVSTLYLVRYNPDHPEFGWKLMESPAKGYSKAVPGFSHHKSKLKSYPITREDSRLTNRSL